MSKIIQGKVERKNLGMGAWALVTAEGTIYELLKAPQELTKVKTAVEVTGNIREDVMTTAMIGPVLEVLSFRIL
jgi:hypothetical protein